MNQVQLEILKQKAENHADGSRVSEITEDNQTQEVALEYQHREALFAKQSNVWMASEPWLRYVMGCFEYRRGQTQHRGYMQDFIHAKYDFPRLFSYYQLALWATRRKSTSWWFTFRYHRALDYHHPFVKAIWTGDISSVQSLLSRKEAFVTDRTSYGETCLYLATQCWRVEMCKLFIREGADIHALDLWHRSPLFARSEPLITLPEENILDIYRCLIEAGDETLIDRGVDTLKSCPAAAFSYLEQHNYPRFNSMSTESRLSIILGCGKARSITLPPKIPIMLKRDGNMDSELIDLANKDGRLIHLVTYKWSPLHAARFLVTFSKIDIPSADDSISYVILAGLSIQQRDENGHALLASIFHGFEYDTMFFLLYLGESHRRNKVSLLRRILNHWVCLLHKSGINLEQYSNWEHRHLLTLRNVKISPRWHKYFRGDDGEGMFIHLIGFDFGPRPQNWTFWFSEPSDECVGDFWCLVEDDRPLGWRLRYEEGDSSDSEVGEEEGEHDPRPIPGAWSEDF